MNIRDLDSMTYREKTLHWMKADPWNPDGARLRFKQPERELRCSTDRSGNVTSMTLLLIGRPCFGIITALMGYKDALKWVKGRGLMPASRCATCRVRESCERLVRERIKASSPLSAAYDEWLRAEGPSKLGSPGVECTNVGRLWKKVGLAAADAGFTSTNDEALICYYEKLDCDARQRDKDRHINKRKRDRNAGVIDDEYRLDLDISADCRMLRLLDLKAHPVALRALTQLPFRSIEDLAEVWLGREILRAEHRNFRAPDVARWIVRTGRRNASATFAALATRVSKDLRRIDRFESQTCNGVPLLALFNTERESWSQKWLERGNRSPLEKRHPTDHMTPLEIAAFLRSELSRRTP